MMALLKASFTATVMVAAAVPFATVGPLAEIVVLVEFAEPAVNTTTAGSEGPGVATATDFDSALVDLREQVESPFASVTLQAPMMLLVPVAAKVGVSPAAAKPFFFTLMEMVEAETPSAVIVEVAVRVVE